MKEIGYVAGAGVSRIDLTSIPFPIEQFYGIHDELHARAILIQHKECFLIISIELTSIRPYEIDTLKRMASLQTGIKQELIWICVTHTFQAPHTRSLEALQRSGASVNHTNELLCNCIEIAVTEAIQQALDQLQPVSVAYAKTQCSINGNRDVKTKNGWWLGFDETGYSNHEVNVLVLTNQTQDVIGISYSMDMQSSVMDGSKDQNGHQWISSDITGKASSMIEERIPGCVAMYCMGAAGDQVPCAQAIQKYLNESQLLECIDYHEEGYRFVEQLGIRLATSVLQAMNQAKKIVVGDVRHHKQMLTCQGQALDETRKLLPVTSYHYEIGPNQTTPIELITIGHIALVGVQPEITSHMGTIIKKHSPYPCTMVVTMVNGGAKYLTESESYDQFRYEAMNSYFAKGSGELFCEAVIRLLQEAYEKERG